MINIYTKNNIDAKPSSSGNYDGTISWDIEILNPPFTYVLGFQGNGNIDWGDSTNEDFVSDTFVNKSHIYERVGIYTIVLTGTVDRFQAGRDVNSRSSVRTIHSMSLEGYLGYETILDSHGEFHNCFAATLNPQFKFSNSILYLNGTFSGCNSLGVVQMVLPPNVISLDSLFRRCDNLTIDGMTIPNTTTNISSLFAYSKNLQFTQNFSIPAQITSISSLCHQSTHSKFDKIILHSGISNMVFAFYNTYSRYLPIWPSSFSSSTINIISLFEHATAVENPPTFENIPADLFWNNSSVNFMFADSYKPFKNAIHMKNYKEIPSSWK